MAAIFSLVYNSIIYASLRADSSALASAGGRINELERPWDSSASLSSP